VKSSKLVENRGSRRGSWMLQYNVVTPPARQSVKKDLSVTDRHNSHSEEALQCLMPTSLHPLLNVDKKNNQNQQALKGRSAHAANSNPWGGHRGTQTYIILHTCRVGWTCCLHAFMLFHVDTGPTIIVMQYCNSTYALVCTVHVPRATTCSTCTCRYAAM